MKREKNRGQKKNFGRRRCRLLAEGRRDRLFGWHGVAACRSGGWRVFGDEKSCPRGHGSTCGHGGFVCGRVSRRMAGRQKEHGRREQSLLGRICLRRDDAAFDDGTLSVLPCHGRTKRHEPSSSHRRAFAFHPAGQSHRRRPPPGKQTQAEKAHQTPITKTHRRE